MNDKNLQFLKNTYFFQNLKDSEISEILKVCHEKSFSPEEIIFEEGSLAEKFYIIISGEVEVWKDYRSLEKDRLAVHKKGRLFGEMALIDNLPRSATVIARGKTRLLYIGRNDFHKIISENSSISLSVMRSVSLMVRKSNDSFVENLRARNKKLQKAYKELKETHEELIRMERLSTLGKISSLILHDIRNPISILRGYAELIRMRPENTEKNKNNANKIINEADRLNRLANEMLDYSRGEIRLNMQIVNIDDMINNVLSSIKDRFNVRKINIIKDIKFKGPVLMDMDRIVRVLFNLADNSRKAMPKGGEFHIKTYEEESSYIIEISDNGIGMNENVVKRIFEPFFSYSESGGTGLGMSIVKNIIEAHEGSLYVESEKNKGACFKIVMPKYN